MCLFQELNTHQCLNGWGKLSSVQWNMPLIKGISFFCEREKPWYMFAWQTRSCYWILQWWKVKDYTPSLYLEGKLESDGLFHLKRLTSRRPRYLRFWDEIYADEYTIKCVAEMHHTYYVKGETYQSSYHHPRKIHFYSDKHTSLQCWCKRRWNHIHLLYQLGTHWHLERN